MFGKAVLCAALALGAPVVSHAQAASQAEGDPYVVAVLNEFNGTLRAEWMDLRVEQIEFLGVGSARASARLHHQGFRWIAGDPRRAGGGSGGGLTYRVDLSDGLGPTLQAAETEAAIDRAMATWRTEPCARPVGLAKRGDASADPDLFDSLFGYGGLGDYRAADVVHAGWLPAEFFERVTGPGGGRSVVAFSVTFIFVGPDGEPTDLDGDGLLDAAHSEIYYNQGFSWKTGGTAHQIDVETVALHETGHSLALGHVNPPPSAVMNPVYAGTRTRLQSTDRAALCSLWAPWGK